MRKEQKALFCALAAGVIITALAACVPTLSQTTTGSLSISINDTINAKTVLPPIDMNAVGFDISGSGPGGASFSTSTTGGLVTVEKLRYGSWDIVVQAMNSEGALIGQGQASTVVHSGQIASVTIAVTPLSGTGSLNITISWNLADIEVPQIAAEMLPVSGSALPLTFDIAGNQGSFSGNGIPVGYYTLTMKLLDNGLVEMGSVDIVRILKDQISTGTLVFDKVNKPDGSLAVNITAEMSNPLTVHIGGSAATKPANRSMNLNASISESSANATYAWYVNGDPEGTGASWTFDSSWDEGFYTISVTAFAADGTRAGSASTLVEVVKPAPMPMPGPVVYYSFNEGTGNIAHDSAGGFDGAITNPNWCEGAYGGCIQSSSRGSTYISVPSSSILSISQTVSIEARIFLFGSSYAQGQGNAGFIAVKEYADGGMAYGLNAGANWAGKLAFVLTTEDDVYHIAQTDGNYPAGVWFHLCGVYDGSTLKLYIDGSLIQQTPCTGMIKTGSFPLWIGKYAGGGSGMDWGYYGKIDEVAIYNRALTAEEVTSHFQNGL